MEGYIITYKANLTSKTITDINYFLFGKVLSKNNKKYYYPGLLDDILYNRLGNGCYFIITEDVDVIEQLEEHNDFFTLKAVVDNKLLIALSARNIKKEKYKGIFVKNL